MNLWPFHFRKWEKRGVPITPAQLRQELLSLGVEKVYLRDSKYRAISHKDFMELVEKYRLSDGSYKVNIRDCDKYAIFFQADVLRGWADCSNGEESLSFGYIEGGIIDGTGKPGGHGYIWQRDDKGKIWFLHGQTATPMDWEITSLTMATG